ncbi:MAG: TldD/PmbA family protein [Candidatus Helarchaeota archaeon]
MVNEILDLIEQRLKAKKVEEYDILMRINSNFENVFLKDTIDYHRQVKNMEFIIRILSRASDIGMGIVHSSEVSPNKLDILIDKCINLSKMNKTTNYQFPEKLSYQQVETTEARILEDPESVLSNLSEELNSSIKNQKKVVPTFGRLGIIVRDNFLRNSNGLDLKSKSTYIFFEYAIKAEEGNNLAEFWDVNLYKKTSHLDLENRISYWSELATDTLKARIPKSRKNAVIIFPPKILMNALNPVIGYHSTGQSHYEKVSNFELNKEVASKSFTIKDNGLLKDCLSSNPWDGEGNPTQETVLIQDGVFKNRIYDQKFAILEGQKSTGNGTRTQDGNVVNNITNLEISEGDISREELIETVKDGLYIEKFSWLNPDRLSGSFGCEIRNARLIQNGKLTDPIKGGNVSGSILDIVKNIIGITKEREYIQNCLFPYIAFGNLNISS